MIRLNDNSVTEAYPEFEDSSIATSGIEPMKLKVGIACARPGES